MVLRVVWITGCLGLHPDWRQAALLGGLGQFSYRGHLYSLVALLDFLDQFTIICFVFGFRRSFDWLFREDGRQTVSASLVLILC